MNSYVIIDVETTGFSPKSEDEITSLTMLKIINNQIFDVYTSLYSVSKPLTQEIKDHTGLTDEKLNGFKSFKDPENINFIKNFIRNFALVAHNVSFDLRFLNHYGVVNPDTKHFCTLEIARNAKLGLENNKLTTISSHCRFPHRPHESLSDCLALFNIIKTYGWNLKFE